MKKNISISILKESIDFFKENYKYIYLIIIYYFVATYIVGTIMEYTHNIFIDSLCFISSIVISMYFWKALMLFTKNQKLSFEFNLISLVQISKVLIFNIIYSIVFIFVVFIPILIIALIAKYYYATNHLFASQIITFSIDNIYYILAILLPYLALFSYFILKLHFVYYLILDKNQNSLKESISEAWHMTDNNIMNIISFLIISLLLILIGIITLGLGLIISLPLYYVYVIKFYDFLKSGTLNHDKLENTI